MPTNDNNIQPKNHTTVVNLPLDQIVRIDREIGRRMARMSPEELVASKRVSRAVVIREALEWYLTKVEAEA